MGPTNPVVLELPPGHEAVRLARTTAAEECVRSGLAELAEDVELVVSELVSNAVLHAGGALRLMVAAAGDCVRVEIYDGETSPPVRMHADDGAMTGRGLALVETLTRRWGVTPTDGGKVVWAEVAPGAAASFAEVDDEELLRFWDDEDVGRQGRYHVVLGEVPTDLLLEAKAHVDNLVREFTLAAAGARAGTTAAVSPQLADLIERVVTGFSEARQAIKRQAAEAAARGLPRVRLDLELPFEAAAAGEEYLRAVDEAHRYCRAARLLTLESPPSHRVFRHWYVGEIIRQLRQAASGYPPAPPTTFESRLLEEIGTAATARDAASRGARLQRLAGALARALTPEAVAAAVLDEGVTALGASGGGILLADDSEALAVPGTVGYDEELVGRLRGESRYAELPAAYAARTGEAVWLESPEERDARFPGLVELERGTASLCAVPLEGSGRCLGAIRFSFSEPRLFGQDEREFVLTLASYTGQALDRARLYEARVDASRRLQRSLLPPKLPDVPGVELAARYRSLGDGVDVGGDFYDAWPAGEAWAVVIGDVCGTGPEAAAVSHMVRYTLRSTTRFVHDAEQIVRTLNDALLELDAAGSAGERFCTAVFGLLRSSGDGVEVRLAAGGHPRPLVRRVDGHVEEVALDSSLLGVLERPEVAVRTVSLAPGDVLLVYTDGLSEARREGVQLSTAGVAALLADAGPSADDVVAGIVEAVADFVDDRFQDDLAVLAVRARLPTDG